MFVNHLGQDRLGHTARLSDSGALDHEASDRTFTLWRRHVLKKRASVRARLGLPQKSRGSTWGPLWTNPNPLLYSEAQTHNLDYPPRIVPDNRTNYGAGQRLRKWRGATPLPVAHRTRVHNFHSDYPDSCQTTESGRGHYLSIQVVDEKLPNLLPSSLKAIRPSRFAVRFALGWSTEQTGPLSGAFLIYVGLRF